MQLRSNTLEVSISVAVVKGLAGLVNFIDTCLLRVRELEAAEHDEIKLITEAQLVLVPSSRAQ